MAKNLSNKINSDNKITKAELLLSTQVKKTFSSWVVASDLDGTFFTPDIRIGYEALFENRYIRQMLDRKHIPLILNTVRRDFTNKFKFDLFALEINPDTIIAGAGTVIYNKSAADDSWEKDNNWDGILGKENFLMGGKKLSWGEASSKNLIEQTIAAWERENKVDLIKEKGNKYLIRYGLRNINENTLLMLEDSVQKLFGKGLRVMCVERLIPAIFGRPTGDLIIFPEIAGKDNALRYVLKQYYQVVNQKLKVFCFGDGIVDVSSYLKMPSTDEYELKQFLTHSTPLAKKAYDQLGDRKPEFKQERGPAVIIKQIETPLPSIYNGPLRKYFSQPSKLIIDRIYPKNLSANDITKIGLKKIIDGVDGFYAHKMSIPSAIREYTLGLLADVADGIRARETIPSKHGQLHDVFADRMREFYQLYTRGINRAKKNPREGLVSLKAAISIILPSIARRQSEIVENYINPETEVRAFWRTRKLILSLFYDSILNNWGKSISLDKEILAAAELKYNERVTKMKNFAIEKIDFDKLSLSQKKSVELWLLYVELLKDAHDYLLKKIPSELRGDFEKWFNSLASGIYMIKVDVKGMRKKFHLEDYGLHFNDFIKP